MRPEIRTPKALEDAEKYTETFLNAISTATGEGVGMTRVVFSFHHDYSDYHRKWNQMRLDWQDFVEAIQSFAVSLEEREINRFFLTHPKGVHL